MRGIFRCTVATAVAYAILGAPAALAQAAIRFDLPAQSLAESLKAVANQTNTNVLFDLRLVAGRQAPALNGELTVEGAISKLLAGSGFTHELVNEHTIVLMPAVKSETTSNAQEERATLRVAQAESAASASASHAASELESQTDSLLAEVIVTAQKRAERLIDVPQSVSVMSADELARLGATQFRDFANTVPGLSFTTAGAGNSQITLRGVTTGFDVSPTTATYVDDVPYGSSTTFANSAQLGLDPALFGLDRIEVLRGPQGTLYGASSMGGLIKYVTRKPSLTGFAVEAQAGLAGTRDGGTSYNANATLNVPLADDKLALRAMGFESHDGGYIDNAAQGKEDVNRSDVYGGHADLLFAPTDVLEIRLSAFLQNIARDGDGTADYAAAGAQPFGSLGQHRPLGDPFDQRFRVVSGTLTFDAGSAELTAISSYQTVRSEFTWDLSSIYVPLLEQIFGRSYSSIGVPVESETDKFTQEVRLASSGEQRLEWLLGGFYTRETSSLAQQFELRDTAGQPALNDLFTFFVPSRYEELAAFGDLTWHFTDRFDATAGVRYAHNRQSFSQTGSGAFGSSADENRATDDVLTYLANARYHFTSQATGYLRYATGYRPGGPAYVTLDPVTGQPNSPTTFEADKLKSYEAGFKAQTADRRFGLDVAGYYIDWSNIQVAFNNAGFSSIHNAPGGATIRGAELALTVRPLRGWLLNGAFAYQDAKLADADVDLNAAKGERLPNVPRFTGTVSADYELPLDEWRPSVGASVRHVGERASGFGSAYRLPEYTTVDVRTSCEIGSVSAQLYVRNLFDRLGQLSIAYPQFGGRVAIVQPRTIGITLAMRF